MPPGPVTAGGCLVGLSRDSLGQRDLGHTVNEDTVTARLVAVQTDGSVRTYQGTYVVRDGVIAQASVRQIG